MNANRRLRWLASWAALGLSPDPTLFDQLCAAYSEPHRRYHTLEHLDDCFTKLDEHGGEVAEKGALEVALWFHDAIYDTHRHDNEEQSGHWAWEVLAAAGAGDSQCKRVHDLILATRHREAPADATTALLVDVDLSSLGAAPAVFDQNGDNIRSEYAWVREEDYRRERVEIFRSFLARPAIYTTPALRERFEAPARANLERTLAAFGA